ncbi:hypothetical protein RUND412_007307 [Rhizina undulata]
MSTHSTTMAENRLHPSIQPHQISTAKIILPDESSVTGKKHAEIFGFGPGQVEPLGAFEVSRGKRLLQVALAVISCLLSAGVVFGYAALKPVLVREGVYREECTEEELREGVWVCAGQELRLNFMFTIAAVATNVVALLVGTVLDQYGPRVSAIMGSVLFAMGCAGFVFADRIQRVDPYLISYLLLALGGPFVFISSFHLSNTFPRHSGLILSMLTGAFDASSSVFLLYRTLYDKTRAIPLRQWFLYFISVPLFIILAQIIIMPGQSYKTAHELEKQAEVEHELLADDEEEEFDDDDVRARIERREEVLSEIDELLGGKDAEEERERKAAKREESGVWGAMHGVPVGRQICSWWFVLITAFTVIQMTRINYFVATIRPQYEFLLHSYPLSVRLNHLFDLLLPLGGIVAIPIIGYTLDHLSTPKTLTLLVVLATVIGILGMLPFYPAALANIILFVLYRPFYYTAVSDYAAKVFGFETFGKVYGLIIALAGIGNLGQTGLDWLTVECFGGDPRVVDGVLTAVAAVVGSALVGFVASMGWRIRRKRLGREAEEARVLDMPGVGVVYGTV